MAKTLDQLRAETRFWLNDPRGTEWDAPTLDTLLNIAYPLVVAKVEGLAQHWNIHSSKMIIEVTAAAREYVFDTLRVVRRPVAFHRVDSITKATQITSSLGRTRLTLRSLSDVQVSAPYPGVYGLERFAGTEFVYVYRNSAGGWVLGFEAAQPRDQVIEVTFVPSVETLRTNDQIPLLVPGDFHHMISMRAAMLAKTTENRINQNVYTEYANAELNMVNELSSLVAHGSRRF